MKVSEEVRARKAQERRFLDAILFGRKGVAYRRMPPQPVRDDRGPQKPWRPGSGGFVPIIFVGWIAVAWIVGIVTADLMPPPNWPRYGNSASWCRPHPYDKLALKPWPFRRGRFTNEAHEGDVDICTGETYRNGRWENR